jgi:hypothetical protein
LDGNHRVSVARQRGHATIEAYVSEFQTPVAFTAEADIDDLFIEAEQVAFMERAGKENASAAGSIRFTCPGCYKDVSQHIEQYRHGAQKATTEPASYEHAFSKWHEEAYMPAIEAIRKNELLSQFPDRTEADLYIWSWQNSSAIEKLELKADTSADIPANVSADLE